MKLTVIRHGETTENVNRIVQGQTHGTLTDEGRKQAKELSQKLKSKNFDYVYSSDLRRCTDTAEYILEFHKDIPFKTVKELREYSFGKYHGRPASEIDWDNMPGNMYTRKPDGGESLLDGRERVLEFLDRVWNGHKDDEVLFITHGGPMRIIRQYVLKRPMEELRDFEIANCEVFEFEIKDPIGNT